MVDYHKRGRGRPTLEKDEGPTTQQQIKRKTLLVNKGGSIDDPIDILYAQRVLTEEQAQAIKLYKAMWARAYGKNNNYYGGIWSKLLPSNSQMKETPDSLKIKNIDRYHGVDNMLKGQSQEGRNCIRTLCEGKIPYYLQSAIWAASKNFETIIKLDDVEDNLKELRRKKSIETESEKRRELIKEIDIIVREKVALEKKLTLYSDKKEPYFNIYAREEFKLSVIGLVRYFNKLS